MTTDNTDQRVDLAKAEHDAANRKCSFDREMAKAEHHAGGMKASFVPFGFRIRCLVEFSSIDNFTPCS